MRRITQHPILDIPETGKLTFYYNGQCTDCVMVVNGRPNVRTCVTRVEAGMRVETQRGLGEKTDENI